MTVSTKALDTAVPSTTEAGTQFVEDVHNGTDGVDLTERNRAVNCIRGLELAVSLYVLVSLLYHRRLQLARQNSAREETGKTRGAKTALSVLCITGALVPVFGLLIDVISFNVPLGSTAACTFTGITSIAIYVVHDAVIYSFLWIRQYVVYKGVIIQRKWLMKSVNAVKWSILVLIIILTASMICLTAAQRRYGFNEAFGKCYSIDNGELLLMLVWGPASFSLHIILFGLFSFPLIRHLRQSRLQYNHSTGFAQTSSRLQSLVRRCLAVSGLCVATDAIVIVVASAALTKVHESPFRSVMYSGNLIINEILIICSFRDWKMMLFPWKRASATGGALTNVSGQI